MIKNSFLALLTLLLLFSSCKKPGCTNENAENYNEKAKTDDGTCKLKADIVFWFDQQKSNQLVSQGETTIQIFLDGQLKGTSFANAPWPQAPACYSGSGVSYSEEWTENPTKTFNVVLKGQNGAVIANYNYTATGGKCNSDQFQ